MKYKCYFKKIIIRIKKIVEFRGSQKMVYFGLQRKLFWCFLQFRNNLFQWEFFGKNIFLKKSLKFLMAILFLDGLGTPRDLKMALKYFQKASDHGTIFFCNLFWHLYDYFAEHTLGLYNAALMYHQGQENMKNGPVALAACF